MLRDDFPNRNLICMLHHLFCSSLLHFVVDKTKDFNIYGILKKEKKKKKKKTQPGRQARRQAGRQAGGALSCAATKTAFPWSFFETRVDGAAHRRAAISRPAQQTAVEGLSACAEPPRDGATYCCFVLFIFSLLPASVGAARLLVADVCGCIVSDCPRCVALPLL